MRTCLVLTGNRSHQSVEIYDENQTVLNVTIVEQKLCELLFTPPRKNRYTKHTNGDSEGEREREKIISPSFVQSPYRIAPVFIFLFFFALSFYPKFDSNELEF